MVFDVFPGRVLVPVLVLVFYKRHPAGAWEMIAGWAA